jgi:hypothetical protein
MAHGTRIILWPKNLESHHFLVDFCAYCESEAEEERIYKSIAKAYGPCNNVTRRNLKRATEHDKTLEETSAEIQRTKMKG